ncbi:glycosyltransferase [Paenibacillaceae bacterium WGS1546]|uniref:glycosyltransferase n=1 Tax=Cohnella sp. WGS1546 TaxID=3366810 RepID=UPI00372D6B23
MKIICCMLTRNNEATLAAALRSVKPHVDDIVAVDTGSTDASARIARELGAHVHSFAWNDDFAEARNVSLAFAKEADWVLVIDSDEAFVWEGDVGLKEWIAAYPSRHAVIAFECRHYETGDSRLLSATHVERLFSPRHYRYEGRIHERLVAVGEEEEKRAELCPFASFRHYGYSSEFHEAKRFRNMALLRKELAERPFDGRTHRYIATELYHEGRYADSVRRADAALSLLADTDTYSRAQAHYYKIMACLYLGRKAEAERAIQASIGELPFYADPYGIRAEMRFGERRWEEACRWYDEWERRLERQSRIAPNHCISLADTFRRHRRLAAGKTRIGKETLGKEVHEMKVALLIVHPQLEMDREELLGHLAAKFKDMTYEVGLWSEPPLDKNEKGVKAWLRHGRARLAAGQSPAQAGSRLAAACQADILWIWHANERLITELDEGAIASAIARNGSVSVRAYSERLGCPWTESRIRLLKPAESRSASLPEADSASEGIVLERPLILPPDKQEAYLGLAERETPLQRLLTAFASQRYREALDMRLPPEGSAEWSSFQFYQILSAINLGRMEEASEKIYNAMEAEISERDARDFVYLYGKLAANVDMAEMKREALSLLDDTLRSNPPPETKHVRTTESDWLSLIAELQWQSGERKQALVSWRHGLESSGYANGRCAYRLAEAICETYKSEGSDRISRAILEAFPADSPAALSLLAPIFGYLNMEEWAALFALSPDRSAAKEPDSPLVSLIMPVYNDTEYLFESIRGILSQTYLDLELIVVDDGSDEEVAAVVRRFAHDRRLRPYRLHANRGLPYALNYGLAKAKGALMGWTSADNEVQPRWLERMVRAISADPQASAVYSDYYHIDKDGLAIETKRLPAYRLNGLQNGGPSMLWRASALRKAGGFDESLFGIEDRDFTVRLALVGRMVHLNEPLYYYRIREGSLSSRIDSGFAGGWPELHEKLKRKWLYWSFI